jgi:signal transduction histidine kinase
MANIDASAEQPVVTSALAVRERFASPCGFARSREGIISVVFCSLAALPAAVVCYVSYQPAIAGWLEESRYAIITATAVLLATCLIAFQLMLLNYRRKRVEIEQRAYEHLADAVESLRDGISLYDPGGRLILSNAAQRQQRDPGHAEIAQGPDGRWLQIRESRTASGNRVRVETDITDLMQHEAALRRAKDEAETANRAKSEFLAMMSHELRTPLNAIIGFSEVMHDGLFGPMPPRYQEYLKDINDSGQHLLQIISDILDMSKLDAGKATLSESLCDVALTIKRCQRLMAHRAESGRVLIEAQLPGDLPGVWADELKLRQIIINLLSNAVKFTRAGGRVAISARDLGPSEASGGLVIEIADNGIGMAAESIPLALAPFRQIDNRLDRKYQGTGLGLPLSNGLVDLHGGVLDIKSQVHLGTTVTIRLPAARRRPRAAADRPSEVEAAALR